MERLLLIIGGAPRRMFTRRPFLNFFLVFYLVQNHSPTKRLGATLSLGPPAIEGVPGVVVTPLVSSSRANGEDFFGKLFGIFGSISKECFSLLTVTFPHEPTTCNSSNRSSFFFQISPIIARSKFSESSTA